MVCMLLFLVRLYKLVHAQSGRQERDNLANEAASHLSAVVAIAMTKHSSAIKRVRLQKKESVPAASSADVCA